MYIYINTRLYPRIYLSLSLYIYNASVLQHLTITVSITLFLKGRSWRTL